MTVNIILILIKFITERTSLSYFMKQLNVKDRKIMPRHCEQNTEPFDSQF